MWLSRAVAWVLCVSIALPSAVTGAEQPPLPQALPKTVAVAAFKNGLAFVVRQGEVQLQSGIGRITPIPNATLGTLWLAPGVARYRHAEGRPCEHPFVDHSHLLRASTPAEERR